MPVVLPVTGNAAFVGATESKGLLVLQDYVNKTGGINGRPLKFDIQDDQNSPAIDVQLFNRIAASKAPVMLGPSLSASVLAATPLLKDGPVTLCFAPGVYPEEGSFVFSPYASIYDLAVVSSHYARKRGWKKIAFLFTTDATGADSDRVFGQVFGAQDSPAQIVADEHFTVTDLGVSAQVARIKAAEPDVVVMFTTGSPASTAMRTLQDSGVTVPILAAWSNAGVAQMTAFKDYLPKELLTPGRPTIVAPDQLPKGLLHDNLGTYVHQFELAGIAPDVLNASSWDAGSLVVATLRALGPRRDSI